MSYILFSRAEQGNGFMFSENGWMLLGLCLLYELPNIYILFCVMFFF